MYLQNRIGQIRVKELGKVGPQSVQARYSSGKEAINPNFFVLGTLFYQVECTLFYMENDAEIFLAHYTWKVAEKGFNMASMMNKLAMINSCEIILEN